MAIRRVYNADRSMTTAKIIDVVMRAVPSIIPYITPVTWSVFRAAGGGQTLNDSGVAFNAANWLLFEIRRKTTDVFEFYINQVLVATHSANISTSNIQYPIMYADNTGGTNFKFYVDYFSMELSITIQRWT